MRFERFFALLSFCVVATAVPRGADAANCDRALILSTYNNFSADHVDWRLASLVTEDIYNEITHDASAHAVIYGVPVGANYSDFQKNISQSKNSHQESLTHDQVRNIMWTGLDPNAKDAYEYCVDAELAVRGLHFAIRSATKNDVTVRVSYNTAAEDKPEIVAHWSYGGPGKDELPTTVHQGITNVVLPRPESPHTLAINYKGLSDSVVITAIDDKEQAPDKITLHKEDKNGIAYRADWQMDPACRYGDRISAGHRCSLDHSQIHEPGNNDPFDRWNLWMDAPGPVYEVGCVPTGGHEIKPEGILEGNTGLCTGEINGGDGEIRMYIKWQQLW